MAAAAGFQGQVVIVAGGTGALGSAVARAFIQEGANVAVTYRTPREYEDLQSSVSADRARLRGHQVDVTSEAEMSRLAYVEFESGATAVAQVRSALRPLGYAVADSDFFVTDKAKAYLARSPKQSVLAFRGTDVDDPTDLGTDRWLNATLRRLGEEAMREAAR